MNATGATGRGRISKQDAIDTSRPANMRGGGPHLETGAVRGISRIIEGHRAPTLGDYCTMLAIPAPTAPMGSTGPGTAPFFRVESERRADVDAQSCRGRYGSPLLVGEE